MIEKCFDCHIELDRHNAKEGTWINKSGRKYGQRCLKCLLVIDNKKEENIGIDPKWLRRGTIQGTMNSSPIVTMGYAGLPVHL